MRVILCDRCKCLVNKSDLMVVFIKNETNGDKDFELCKECSEKVIEFIKSGIRKTKDVEAKEEAEQAEEEVKESTRKKKEKKEKKEPLDMGKVMALYKAGWTYKQIAEEMGTTAGTIGVKICDYKKKACTAEKHLT